MADWPFDETAPTRLVQVDPGSVSETPIASPYGGNGMQLLGESPLATGPGVAYVAVGRYDPSLGQEGYGDLAEAGIYKLDAAGGAPAKIADIEDDPSLIGNDTAFAGISVASDGSLVVATRTRKDPSGPTIESSLVRLDPATGQETAILQPFGVNTIYGQMATSPTGKVYAYAYNYPVRGNGITDSGFFEIDPAAGTSVSLSHVDLAVAGLAGSHDRYVSFSIAPDGNLVVGYASLYGFADGVAGNFRLARVDVGSGSSTPLPLPPNSITSSLDDLITSHVFGPNGELYLYGGDYDPAHFRIVDLGVYRSSPAGASAVRLPTLGVGSLVRSLSVVPGSSVIVGSSLPVSTYGQSVTFTVIVTGGGPAPTGNVQFYVDGNPFGGPATFSGGSASSPSTTLLGAGDHIVTVTYPGDPNYGPAYGSTMQTVHKASLLVVADDASMNHYDAVPDLTYHLTGFVNGEDSTSAGVAVSATLGTTASSTSAAGYYPITPSVSSLTAANYRLGGTQDGNLTVKPRVMDIRVYYGSQSYSILGLTRNLPFVNIKALDVLFSDDVDVSESMLGLAGVSLASYGFSGFRYDPAAFDATWTLASDIDADRLVLDLAGVTAPPATGSGANIAADAVRDAFAVLPGDVNNDGVVTSADGVAIRNRILAETYLGWADLDGNGTVDINDFNAARKRIGKRLP